MRSFLRSPGLILIFIFPLVLWSCLEYTITTQVMPDGRILRTVVVKGDSTDIFNGSFLVPSDSTWTISTRLESRSDKDIGESKVFVYEAKKEFINFEALNKEFFNDSSINDHIAIRVNLKKQFRWFYNHYLYTETYYKLFPFHSVPVSDYLTDNELKIHQSDEKEIYYSRDDDKIKFKEDTLSMPVLIKTDSARFKALRDTIEQKFESWQKINIYNDFFTVVLKALGKMKIPVDSLTARHPFYSWLDQEKTFETGIENDNAFLDAAGTFFNVHPSRLMRANPEGFKNFKRKFRVAAYSLESYTSQVLMPGMIINTDAGNTDVNVASWTFKIDDFYATDYTMLVESRVVNKWFVISAGVVLILIIALLLVRLFRK